MAVRALKQTGSRNIEAALDYISKMGYLDPRTELIVRVIKQTSPGTHTHAGMHARTHAHTHTHTHTRTRTRTRTHPLVWV